MRKDSKKYNSITKGYKIDIFASIQGKNKYLYVGSTDWSKTCKEAKEKYISKNQEFCKNKGIYTRFDRC